MPKPTRASSLAAAVILLAACGGSPSAPPPPAAPASLASVADGEVQARALARSGPRPGLGADADALFAELDLAWAAGLPAAPWALAGQAAPSGHAAPSGQVALRGPGRSPALGETGIAATTGMLTALEPGLDPAQLNGRTGSKHEDLPLGSADHSWILSMAQSGSTLSVGITARTTYTAKDGRRVDELATASAEIQLCPDAAGKVPFHYAFSFNVTTPGGGSQVNLSGSGTATVGDEGQLTGWSSQADLGFAAQGGAVPVSGGDALVHLSRTYDGGGRLETSTRTVERDTTAASVGTAIGEIGNQMPAAMERYLLEKAQARWQNGACVEILTDGVSDANTVAPSSTSAFTGRVRHKFEGGDLAAPIFAALAGGQRLAPTARTPAPVSYAYVAPPEDKKQATASFETRSRRGCAKRQVTFHTRAQGGYGGTLAFHWTATSSTETVSADGTATVRFVAGPTAGGGSILQADPTSGSVSVTRFDVTGRTRTCTLTGAASGGPGSVQGSMTVLVAGPPSNSYMFAGVAQAQGGTLRCVRTSDGAVTNDPLATAANVGTVSAPPDPGWQPLGDGKLLTGSATWNVQDGATTSAWTTDWTLTPQ